jgi:hypothetical protein
MPPVPTISATRAAERWSRRAAAASADYSDGVQQTSRSWASSATAAKANWAAGVTAAQGRGAYEKGIAIAGDARWKKNTTEKGPMRYAQGVQLGSGDFAAAIGPVLEMISRTDLAPRGPVGSDANYMRSATIGKALRKLRTG